MVRGLNRSCWIRPLKRYCKFSLVVSCYNFVKKGTYTKCLGASSTTSAGWSVPMLAKQAPLQPIYFRILSTKKNSRKTSYIKKHKAKWDLHHIGVQIVLSTSYNPWEDETRASFLCVHGIDRKKKITIHNRVIRKQNWDETNSNN